MEVSRDQIEYQKQRIKQATNLAGSLSELSKNLEAYKESLITLLKAFDEREGTKGLQSQIEGIDIDFGSSVYTSIDEISSLHEINAVETRGKFISEEYISEYGE